MYKLSFNICLNIFSNVLDNFGLSPVSDFINGQPGEVGNYDDYYDWEDGPHGDYYDDYDYKQKDSQVPELIGNPGITFSNGSCSNLQL